MYRDPSDGQMKPLIGGNKVVDNFQASDDQPTDPNIDLWLDTDDTTTGQIVQTMSGAYSATHLADWTSTNQTGYLLITIPGVNTMAMFNLELNGYTYSANGGAFKLIIGGYTYPLAPSWVNMSADAVGRLPNGSQMLDVKYLLSGVADNATYAIAIGTSSFSWSYPQLVLGGFAGYTSASIIGTSGWGLSFTTDISGWTTYATKQAYSSRMWQGTQAEYDAITTKDSQILYVVNG